MSTKTRLTKEMRSQLEQLARASVKDSPEFEKPFQQARSQALGEIVRVSRLRLPPKELAILRKHNVAVFTAAPVVITEPDIKNPERRYIHIPFVGSVNNIDYAAIRKADEEEKDGIWMPRGCNSQIALDDNATKSLDYWLDLAAARAKRVGELLNDLYTLISNTRNLEDLEAVWPAAMQIRTKYPVANLPAIKIDDVVERIRAAIANKNL